MIVLLSETFKDAYLFNKDRGDFGQTLRYFSKASQGIQLCATFRSTKVVISDTTLDREAV